MSHGRFCLAALDKRESGTKRQAVVEDEDKAERRRLSSEGLKIGLLARKRLQSSATVALDGGGG